MSISAVHIKKMMNVALKIGINDHTTGGYDCIPSYYYGIAACTTKNLSKPIIIFYSLQDLVITSIISAEEFWSSHAAEYMKQKQGPLQDVGVSGKIRVYL